MTAAPGKSILASAVVFTFAAWISLLHIGALRGLFAAWSTDEYGHGPFIVIIALFWTALLLQQKRPQIAPCITGVFLLFAALAVKLFGALIANNWSSQISLIICFFALFMALFGRRAARVILPPAVFLLFAVPLPATVTPALTAELQLLSSDLGVAVIQIFGLPVFQEGNVIDLGGYKLQVAEACSGLRYLFPLMSLGYLAAFCSFETMWKRWILFLLTVPIAVGLNVVRIVLVSVTVDYWGIAMAQGLIHAFEGWAIFLGCLACLAGAETVLARVSVKEEAPLMQAFSFSLRKPLYSGKFFLSRRIIGGIALVLALATAGQLALADRFSLTLPSRRSFALFPLHAGPWSGQPETLSADDLRSLKLDDYLMADYSEPASPYSVNFYIAYYASQTQDSPIHSPRICIPGAGWEIVSIEPVTLNFPAGTIPALTVNKAIIQRDSARELVFYWFRESGQDVASSLRAKLLLVSDALRLGRTDGSLIRLSTPIAEGQTEQQAEQRLTAFLGAALPLLPAYLPGR